MAGRLRRLCTLFCFLLSAATVARAEVITINPGDFAVGTNISELFDGVSLSINEGRRNADGTYTELRSAARVTSGPILSVEYDGHALGYNGLAGFWVDCYSGRQRGVVNVDCFSAGPVLELRFDAPTNFLEIDGAWSVDPTYVYAFDVDGELIAACGFLGQDCASWIVPSNRRVNRSRVTLERAERDIAWAIFGSEAGAGTATSIRYGVPEPGTLALTLLGLVGLIRRRTRVYGSRDV